MSEKLIQKPQAKLIQILKGEIFRLKVPMEIPETKDGNTAFSGSVNSYLVKSDKKRWVIIDPGFYTKTGIEAWNKVLEKLSIGPDDIECILITHFHPDHSGMAGWFSKWTHAPIHMNPKDMPAYSYECSNSNNGDETIKHMRHYGMKGPMSSIIESQAKIRSTFVYPCEKFLPMNDRDIFPVCSGNLHVIHTPGHTDGHCVLLLPEKRILFSADLLLPVTFSPICLHHFGDQNPVKTFLATLRNFLDMDISDFTILPGHGWRFDDPTGRAKLQAEYYLKQAEWYYKKCVHGMDTAWKIALEIFRDSENKRKLRFIMGEAMAFMEYLAEEGKVGRRIDSDGLHFIV